MSIFRTRIHPVGDEPSARAHFRPRSFLHWLARLMRRRPFLQLLLSEGMRLFAARFTFGVTGVVFNERGEVLLLEHVFRGRWPWGLPGGWVGRNERPQDALRRELMEEVGLPIQVGPPVLVELDQLPGHVEAVFMCKIEGEVGAMSHEILAARWVSPDALPEGLKSLDREAIRRAVTLRRLVCSISSLEV